MCGGGGLGGLAALAAGPGRGRGRRAGRRDRTADRRGEGRRVRRDPAEGRAEGREALRAVRVDAAVHAVHAGRRDKASFWVFLLGRMLGVVVHDRYALYDAEEFVGFLHQLCVSHLLRDLQDAVETYPEAVWPVQLQQALRGLVHQANLARAAVLAEVPAALRDPLVAEYRGAVRVGLRDVPAAEKGAKQPVGRCLLECLRDRQDDMLRFVFDLDVWPTNNQSEGDLRPFKTQQKISGRLTSAAVAACRLQIASYLSTTRKHSVSALHALRLAFRGTPWMPPPAVAPT
nr:transposase [Frankia casuarinae]